MPNPFLQPFPAGNKVPTVSGKDSAEMKNSKSDIILIHGSDHEQSLNEDLAMSDDEQDNDNSRN